MRKSVIFLKKIENKYVKDRIVRNQCHYISKHRGAAHSVCVPSKIPIVFHNGSNSDYHFIIKEFAEETEKQFTFLGEDNEKYNIYISNRKRKLQELAKL